MLLNLSMATGNDFHLTIAVDRQEVKMRVTEESSLRSKALLQNLYDGIFAENTFCANVWSVVDFLDGACEIAGKILTLTAF